MKFVLIPPDSECYTAQLIFDKENASNNVTRAHSNIGKEIYDHILNSIRKFADQCTNLQGFLVSKPIGGGSDLDFSSSKDCQSTMVRSLRSFSTSILLSKSLVQSFSPKKICLLPNFHLMTLMLPSCLITSPSTMFTEEISIFRELL